MHAKLSQNEKNNCFISAISTLGISEYDPHPAGSENNQISLETFTQHA